MEPVTKETPGNVIDATDLNWEMLVEHADLPVAVMFYSPTCAFCHQMEPHFRSFSAEFRGRCLFVRTNILSNQWTAERYGVRSTPTFTFFCIGKPVQEMVGAVYPALLRKMIEEVLLHGAECAKNSNAIDYEITGYG
jgi:thioredoxin-like negative regulator of GroEL